MLLDTHSLLWLLQGGGALGPEARARLDAASTVRFSSISIAEIRIKELLGRLIVPADLLDRIERAGLQPAAFGVSAADGLAAWPTLVRHDPFDRLLLAQAVAIGSELLTADRVLLGLTDAPVVDARR